MKNTEEAKMFTDYCERENIKIQNLTKQNIRDIKKSCGFEIYKLKLSIERLKKEFTLLTKNKMK